MALHRRFFSALVGWRSPEGRALFSAMVSAGALESYFPLAAQLTFEPDPAKAGLACLSMVLNALGVDPGRTWKSPWRWYAPEMIAGAAAGGPRGAAAFAALAARNGAAARAFAAGGAGGDEHALRAAVAGACTSLGPVTLLVALYCRRALLEGSGSGGGGGGGGSGSGGGGGGGGSDGAPHASAVAGYHAGSDTVLLLDVRPGEGCEPAVWVPLPRLHAAMAAAGAPAAGWVCLQRREEPPPLA
jgi:glutathione gamma-glutamylcysteinyltransferase